MKWQEKQRYVSNPALGLLPLLLFAFLNIFISFTTALSTSFLISLLGIFIVFSRWVKRKIYNVLYIVSLLILTFFSFLSLLPWQPYFEHYTVIFSVPLLLFFVFMIFRKKKKIMLYSSRLVKGTLTLDLKRSLYELFFICRIIIIVFLIYNIACLLYIFVFKQWHTPENHRLIFSYIRMGLLLGVMLFEHIRIYYINKHLECEEWLPIIDDNARVVGRISRSISYQSKEKYLHPKVRIFLFYKGRVYLSKRVGDFDEYDEYDRMDTPFRRDLYFREDFNECVDDILHKVGMNLIEKPKFMFNYTFESRNRKRILFLYHLVLKDESITHNKLFPKGKFWTQQEIENNLGKDVFGECFEQEFELLKTTIFPVEKYINNIND